MVTTAGLVSDDEARELTDRAITLLRRTRATRVLGDCRAMESAPSMAAVYWSVNNYANQGVPKQTRIALVHPQTPRAVELAQFYETVCFNRQYQTRLFHSSAAAEAWLDSSTAT